MAVYSSIPIIECGEKLVKIPDTFAFTSPHLYMSLGAPYAELSPFYVRAGVLERLEVASSYLKKEQPNWRIKIFDAYRPVAVQEFMVNYTKHQLAKAQGIDLSNLDQEQELMKQVYKFWAVPSLDPAMPPPHSTGAAIDITLVNQDDCEINMGGEIDEISDRSIPDYYKNATDSESLNFHHHRQLLKTSMIEAGFRQHPHEWWHFSFRDQMWCWLENSDNAPQIARYGRTRLCDM